MSDRYIQHITLTTGDTRRSYRDEVAADAVERISTTLLPEALAADVPAGDLGPQIPDTNLYLVAMSTGRCGVIGAVAQRAEWRHALQHIKWARSPYGTIAVCAERRCSRRLWSLLHHPNSIYVTDPQTPPVDPWCAWSAVRPEYDEREGMRAAPDPALDDFIRCFAWAWI